ncbi:MAG: hypothetical protein JWQ96_2663 [Segetibacter sp.]|nr:hypothetical protein [Segetibacter sp.]
MYRKLILSIVLAVVVMSADAQFRKIPAEVTDSFETRYPTAKHVNWRDQITAFVAEFTIDGEEIKSFFNSKGEWLKSTRKTSMMKLSPEVKDGLNKSKFAKWTVTEILEQQEKDKELQFRVTVNKEDATKRFVFFNNKGQLLRDQIAL